MILTPHLLSGAVISEFVPSIPLLFLLSYLSHYILDAIPHWDYSIEEIESKRWREAIKTFGYIILDGTVGAVLIIALADKWLLAIVAGFAAALPDFLTFCSILLPRNKILKAHGNFHRQKLHWFTNKKSFRLRVWCELALTIFLIALLKIF